jgi:hypothetical protein
MMLVMRMNEKIKSRMVALAGVMLLLVVPGVLTAQQKVSDVRVIVRDIRQERDSVRAILEIEATGISVAPREQMYLFPVIRDGMNERKMPPVVINGRIQQAVADRTERLSGYVEPVYASFVTKGRKPFHKKIAYSATIPLEDWMRDANVAIGQERRNCRCEFHHLSMEMIAEGIRFIEKPERGIYDLPVTIPVPPREEIKYRSESGEALIIYTVGNAEIKPALGDNRAELDKIRRSLENVKTLQGVKINSMTISSYASPEGGWRYNFDLSERRAASLLGWLRRNHDLPGMALSARGFGEDWTGFEALLREDTGMADAEKESIFRMMEETDDPDKRERQLKQLNDGRTYRYVLAHLFPELRRSAYRIDFTVPEYSLETIKDVFRSRPSVLSLYEFYLLANEYEPGSRQFMDVIATAARMFPDEKVSRISMAVFSYLSNDVTAALEYLDGLEDDPDAWIYFSSFHALNGELDKAEEYAKRAGQAGNPEAVKHLRLIERYKVDENIFQEKMKEWEMYGIK